MGEVSFSLSSLLDVKAFSDFAAALEGLAPPGVVVARLGGVRLLPEMAVVRLCEMLGERLRLRCLLLP
jgi:hypothetical protein